MSSVSKILLVDDDPGIRASLKFSLELEGFEVSSFESGEALADIPDFPDAACLVVDYRLPGMDGLSLLALLRQRGSVLPAIIITGAASRSIREQADKAGATFIEKPLLSDALSAAIRMLIQNSLIPAGEEP